MKRSERAADVPGPSLPDLRRQIERIDEQLVDLVAERMRLATAVGAAKQSGGRPTLDPAREAAVVRRAGALARAAGLPEEDVRTLFWDLIAMARRLQMEARP